MSQRVDISNLLQEMRTLKSQVQGVQKPQGLRPEVPGLGRAENPNQVPGFGEVMTQAISKVNETQKASSAMAEAYERGVPGVDITDVMIASQKASVSFQAAVQVRNKLVEAYRDIMNMPI